MKEQKEKRKKKKEQKDKRKNKKKKIVVTRYPRNKILPSCRYIFRYFLN